MRDRQGEKGSVFQTKTSRYVLFTAVVLLVLLGVYLVLSPQGCSSPPPAEEPRGSIEGRFEPSTSMLVEGQEYYHFANYFTNILIIGVDRDNITEQTAFRSGGQADFLMLLSIDRHKRTITPIHIDRDTIANVKVYSPFGHEAGINRMQISLSHAFGSNMKENCENTIWAVEQMMHGIRIDHHLVLDMTGIAIINDALGGVEVTLEEDFSHLDPVMKKGTTLTLQGKQAEYFVRGRHEIGDHTNVNRMKRQRVYLNALSDLLTARIKTDADFVTDTINALGEHVHTTVDSNLINTLSYTLEHYDQKEIVDLAGEHKIGADGYMEFHPDETKLKLLIRDVYMVQKSEVGL